MHSLPSGIDACTLPGWSDVPPTAPARLVGDFTPAVIDVGSPPPRPGVRRVGGQRGRVLEALDELGLDPTDDHRVRHRLLHGVLEQPRRRGAPGAPRQGAVGRHRGEAGPARHHRLHGARATATWSAKVSRRCCTPPPGGAGHLRHAQQRRLRGDRRPHVGGERCWANGQRRASRAVIRSPRPADPARRSGGPARGAPRCRRGAVNSRRQRGQDQEDAPPGVRAPGAGGRLLLVEILTMCPDRLVRRDRGGAGLSGRPPRRRPCAGVLKDVGAVAERAT